ncbi:GNAT family N-acetyltransferase [Providencia sneebia]|uniref:Acetyltransferase n=1 Tax=Providencia sneebia DSM 19967 TaxID=1141660 RepID=K8WN24_9GAMM|nr:GNAT family N-acetyltransferase [Providencia sneebia]EKT57580.1 acetyltransferase [Providencia sneebia DSM 19967]
MNIPLYYLRHYQSIEKTFWNAICEHSIQIEQHTICYLTPLDSPIFNFIYLQPESTISALKQAHHLFIAQKKDHTLVIPEEMLQKVQGEVELLGYKRDSVTTAMALALEKQLSVELPKNQVDIVFANHDLALWAKPLVSAFYIPDSNDQVIHEYVRYHEEALLQGSPQFHLVLLVNGEPATSMTVTIEGAIARFDDIGTEIAHQGKGYATQLIDYALAFCRQQNVEYCFLDASEAGLGLYKKFGFEPLFRYINYVWCK